MAVLVAGCAAGLIVWFDTLSRQDEAILFSNDAGSLAADVDEAEPFILSRMEPLNSLVESKERLIPAAIPPIHPRPSRETGLR